MEGVNSVIENIKNTHVAMISSQRQITLPQFFLEELGLKPKRRVSIELHRSILVIKPIVVSAQKLSGSLSKKSTG